MILIEARRWWQRTYGNTYHSVMVTCFDGIRNNLCIRGKGCKHRFECFTTGKDTRGTVLGYNNFVGGYGEQYLMTAFEILAEVGIFPYEKTNVIISDTRGNWTPKESVNKNRAYSKFQDALRTRQHFIIRCFDISRKRDLAFNECIDFETIIA